MNPADQYCHFFDDSAFEETGRPGFRRRIIGWIRRIRS